MRSKRHISFDILFLMTLIIAIFLLILYILLCNRHTLKYNVEYFGPLFFNIGILVLPICSIQFLGFLSSAFNFNKYINIIICIFLFFANLFYYITYLSIITVD